MDWLKSIAPTAASLLGGPLAGMAVEAVGSALGMKDATKDKVKQVLSAGALTAEQMMALKSADAQLVIQLKELDIDLEKVHAADRDSARKMAAATGDLWTPRLIALMVFLTWAVIQYSVFTTVIHEGMRELVARMLGTLDAVLMAVVYYYYGSSSGSKEKTEALARTKKGEL